MPGATTGRFAHGAAIGRQARLDETTGYCLGVEERKRHSMVRYMLSNGRNRNDKYLS